MPRQSRGDLNIERVEQYCLYPSGLERGQRVRLSMEQRDTGRRIYDRGAQLTLTGPLVAYLALPHVCGPEAVAGHNDAVVSIKPAVDIFMTWNATGPQLKEVLKRDGERSLPQAGHALPPAKVA